MKQYLKMTDVFPVEIRTDDESGSLICDGDGVILESFSGDKVADYALHAINSHDELVQMNQELLAALEQSVGLMVHFGDAYGCVPSNYIEHKASTKAIFKAKGGAA